MITAALGNAQSSAPLLHVLLIPIGSHGDVHPFVGLGVALRARGHRVTLVTNALFEDLARMAGLEFAALGTEEEFRQATENPDLWQPMKGFRLVMKMLCQLVRPLYEIIAAINEPGQTVLAAQVTAWGARIAQESLRVPMVTVHLQPAVFLSTIEPPKVPLRPLLKLVPNRLRPAALAFAERNLVDPIMAPEINALRADLGLAPVSRIPQWWHSPQQVLGLFPAWFAPPAPDWPPHVTLSGFPLFDERDQVQLDDEVERFLNTGSPPIVFTAGSAMRHGAEFFRAAVDACQRLGRRGVLLARFGDQVPGSLPPTIRHFSYVPFSLILPRAAALVHHGGIGTTAQALAAGIPQLVVPLAHDQPDNAERLELLGVGRTIAPKKFRAPHAAKVLRTLLEDPAVLSRARELSQRMNAEAALETACGVIESTLVQATPSANSAAR